MKPLVKWSGGKAQEISIFKKHYPTNYDNYIEPFVGGGAVFFDLSHYNNVINDIHKDLINFYQQIKNGYATDIYNLMSQYTNTEKDYYYIRDQFIPKNDIEKAFVFFYLRKTCYRGMLRYNKKGKFNIPFGRYKTYNFEILLDDNYYNLLKNTEIFNLSFEDIFQKYNDKDNFVFLDPPYDSVFTDYGYCSYDRDQHLKLYECFINTKNKCLMIIGETDFINDLYKGYIQEKYNKSYAFKIHSNRINANNNHLIIKNY